MDRPGPNLASQAVPAVLVDHADRLIATVHGGNHRLLVLVDGCVSLQAGEPARCGLPPPGGDHGADDWWEVRVERRDRHLSLPLRCSETENRAGELRSRDPRRVVDEAA